MGQALLASPDPKASVPIYISSGHMISLHTAIHVALACSKMGRVSEPIRLADALSRQCAKASFRTTASFDGQIVVGQTSTTSKDHSR